MEVRVPTELAAVGVTVGGVWRETLDSEGLLATPGDPAVALLAERQGGAVSTGQLLAAGIGQGAIELRVRRGRLHHIHRGVYAVGTPRLTARGRLWAALLACGGPGAAVLSHGSAAAVWDLLPSPAKFDVTTLGGSRSTKTIRVHRTTTLTPADITEHDGLPVTTVARTLIDLATTLSPHRVERVVHRAEHLRLLDTHSLIEQFARANGRRTKALRQALETLKAHDPDITRSKLEERFLALILKAQLPRPEVNAMVGGHEVDFFWPEHRLIVETDGAGTHATPTAFEDDRHRDAELTTLGYRVVRFTRRQVVKHPRATLATLVLLLAADG
jgi:very-short-patch-repair endonuclease